MLNAIVIQTKLASGDTGEETLFCLYQRGWATILPFLNMPAFI